MESIIIEEVDIFECLGRVLGATGVLAKSIILTSWELRKLPALVIYPNLSIGLETKLTGYGTAIEVTTANVVV
jgi:hypothetical protein